MNLRKIDKFQMDESIKLALKEDITSEDIFQEQRRAVSKLQSDPKMFQDIKEKLEALFLIS